MRDDWRNKKEDFENKLSIILGVPWAFNYDTHGLYQLAIDSGSSCEDAIKRPGVMYAQ